MMAQAQATHSEDSMDAILPIPKINVPPAHFFHRQEETVASVEHFVASHHDITHETISDNRPISWNAARDIRFTLMIITLVIGINVCIAWLLGASSTNRISPEETGNQILMQPSSPNSSHEKLPATSSEVYHQRNAYHLDASHNSFFLNKEDRKSLLQKIITSPTPNLAEINNSAQ